MDKLLSYKEQREQLKAEQEGKSYEDVKDQLQTENEYLIEMDKLPTQNHIWIDRGQVMSCEGAAHANHQVFKRLK